MNPVRIDLYSDTKSRPTPDVTRAQIDEALAIVRRVVRELH